MIEDYVTRFNYIEDFLYNNNWNFWKIRCKWKRNEGEY